MFGQNKSQRILKENVQTVEDKYGPHFEYKDLCNRLKKVKTIHYQNTNKSSEFKKKTESYIVKPEKTNRRKSKKLLPKVTGKIKPKVVHKSEGRLKKSGSISGIHLNVLKRTRSKVSKHD